MSALFSLQGLGDLDARKLTLEGITLIGSYTYTPLDSKATAEASHSGVLGDLDWVEQRELAEGRSPSRTSTVAGSPIPRCCCDPEKRDWVFAQRRTRTQFRPASFAS